MGEWENGKLNKLKYEKMKEQDNKKIEKWYCERTKHETMREWETIQ